MESQLTEALTFPAENYSQNFFRSLPSDSRFLQNTFQKFMPSGSIDEQTIEFCLDRYDSASIYLIQQACLKVQFVILKKDNSLPDKDAFVAPVNNVLHSLFESVRLIINDKTITRSASNYPYKAYITNCLTYSTIVKLSQLNTEGWYNDTAHHMEGVHENAGFLERNQLFRKNFAADGEYRGEGAQFMGRLLLDLVACETGLPPGCKIKIELDKSSDSFVILTQKSDPEQSKIKFLNICLYIPVAQLAQPVYQQLSTLHTKEDVAIHFRRLEIRPFSLPRNSVEFNSSNLFSDEMPCRLIICFIETATKNGKYQSNPFNFKRSWIVPKDNIGIDQSLSQKEVLLEARIKNLEKELSKFENFLSPSIKGKGRGKGKSQQSNSTSSVCSQPQQSTSRNRTFQRGTRPPSIASDAWTEDLDDEVESFYLKNVEVILNGSQLDQIDDTQTEDECMAAFFRMYYNNGQMNSLYSCGISYDDFRHGFFFSVHDLSTSGKCATNFLIPTIRVGHLRIRCLFSQPLPIDLSMICFCEFESTLFVAKTGRVTGSFT